MIDFGPPSPSSSPFARPTPAVSRLIVRELPLKDPFALYAAIRRRVRTCFLLESAPGPERLAEFTYLGFEPEHIYTLREGTLFVDGRPLGPVEVDEPLAVLRGVLSAYHMPIEVQQPKYFGGLVGYISYDFARHLEPLLQRSRPPTNSSFPDFELGLYLDGVIFDHQARQAFYFSHSEDRCELVRKALRELGVEPQPERERKAPRLRVGPLESDTSKAEFEANVARALELIREGEVFQLVLARRLRAHFAGDLFAFYAQLRAINPSPYMFCLEFERGSPQQRTIAGSSPEMLVAVRDRTVITYPIAGTRPLGRDAREEARYCEELLADEKERAEHAMLVDLARNDVGRVSAFGDVRVPELMKVERFSHVQHLVSRVEGTLREGLDALDALAALFPAGTVTGAPKLRAMEWIDRLERSPRGPYAGVVGYLSLTGDLDTAITIRTLFARGDELYLQAGAGIVADSIPTREWLETEHKLQALITALELAQGVAEQGEGEAR